MPPIFNQVSQKWHRKEARADDIMGPELYNLLKIQEFNLSVWHVIQALSPDGNFIKISSNLFDIPPITRRVREYGDF